MSRPAEASGVQSVAKSGVGFVLTTHRHMHNDATRLSASVHPRRRVTTQRSRGSPRTRDGGRGWRRRIAEEEEAEEGVGEGGVAAGCRRERVAGLGLGVALYGGMRTRRVAGAGGGGGGGGGRGGGWYQTALTSSHTIVYTIVLVG